MANIINEDKISFYIQEYMIEKYNINIQIEQINNAINSARKESVKNRWNEDQFYGAVINSCKQNFIA